MRKAITPQKLTDIAPSLADQDSACSTIVEELGMEFFQKLQQVYGGCELKLPKTPGHLPDDHLLVTTFGRQDADRLCVAMFGEIFYVPRGYHFYRNQQRLTEAQEALAAGIKSQDMALKIGVSQRQLRRIKLRLAEISASEDRAQTAIMAAE